MSDAVWPRPVRFGEDAAIAAITAELTNRAVWSQAPGGVDRAEMARWGSRTGLTRSRLLDRLAAEIALGFQARHLDYNVCDGAVNALCPALYWDPLGEAAEWADLFWQTYLAFDAGEYPRHGKPDEDAVEVYTRPLIAAIVERLIPDGGWHGMFHDASVTSFATQGDELRIETEEFACSCTEIMPAGRIIIAGVRCVHRDNEVQPAFETESDDAEIHGLDAFPEGVRLWLIWHYCKPKALDLHRSYWFPGATVRVEALAGGPLVPRWTPPAEA